MEALVAQRTAALEEKSAALEQSLDELHAAQALLIQQEKLASLGGLTAGIAHEIKNPLNFVVNFAGLNAELAGELRHALDAGDRQAADEALGYLEMNARKIYEHGQRADGILRGMLDHAQGQRGERLPVDLNDFVEEHAALAYHGARDRHGHFRCAVEVDVDADVDAMTVEAAPQELGRVLLNLLGNAFDAVRERAARTAGGDGDGYDPRVRVRTRRAPGGVVVEVEDNGVGIPAALRPRVFEPFFTTKPTGRGNVGLGLSLAHDIATAHGGTLTAAAADGATTFTLTLPARTDGAPA
jgi:signal transduction histidine kinase